ncbi:MAG: PQQ-binding-like beta-propeller repeat protein [Bacteroidales bacterium]|nr:PQQ-binding-like beta-propeller repeat protein [Bacteroidales bacterium]
MDYSRLLKTGITLFSFLIFPVIAASADFSGAVYIDLNKNDRKDPGEKGVKGVPVSDGLHVVLTDMDGEYRLPGTPKSRFVFITAPSGFRTVHRFYIRTDGRASAYNFGLTSFPLSKNKSVKFIQLADTEAGDDFGWVGPVRDYAANEGISFIVHTGDICYEKGLNFHGRNVTGETMGVPVYYCVGNHDLVAGEYGEELFEKNFGPPFYSFDAGNTHFMVTPMITGDYQPSYTKEDVYRWMKNDLLAVAPGKNIVVFNHNLLTMDEKFIYGINETEQINLNEYNLKAWIYGHWHSNYMIRHGKSGITSFCTAPPNKGGIDHSPGNFPVYEINWQGEIAAHPRYNYLNNHLAVVTPAGNQCALDENGQLLVSVNAYSTSSPTEKIEYRIEGTKKWTALSRQSDWNWSGKYPAANLKSGISYRIGFRTTLKNGDQFTGLRYFIITDVSTDKKDPADSRNDALQLKWIVNTGSNIGMCSPIYADGHVYVAAIDDFGQKNNILAYDGASGVLLWKYRTENPVKNTMCLADEKVLATDEGGIVYAINIKTGELVWKKDLGIGNVPLLVTGGVVHNGVFYCGYGNFLSALDCNDGRLIWKNRAWNGGEGTTSTMSVFGNTLIAGSNWRALYGHELQTGAKKWEVSKDGIRYCNGTAVLVEDTMFFAAERALIKMDPASGTIYAVHPVPYDLQVATTPLITDRMIVTGTSAEGIVAFERYSLKELWKVKTGASLVYTAPYSRPSAATVESSPILVGDLIIFGASDGYLYAIDKNNGRILTKVNLGAPVWNRACIKDNSLFVADFSGNLSCFSLPGN